MKTEGKAEIGKAKSGNPESGKRKLGVTRGGRLPVSGGTVWGFTLIELLVVIGVISILAALIIPITRAVNRQKVRAKARAELTQVQTAIEAYKAKLGYYPPDNPVSFMTNQLYFELLGTTLTNDAGQWVYKTLDGSDRLPTNSLFAVFGPGVGGFANSSMGAGSDEGRAAEPFLNGLKPGQIYTLPLDGSDSVKYLVCSVRWPDVNPAYAPFGAAGINPFRYISSSPIHNPNSFDLWVDVIIDGQTNRISNWSQKPLIVSTPLP